MRVISPSHEILQMPPANDIEKLLEVAGRVCYKSEDRITQDSAREFISRIVASGHESVIEHASVTVRFICDRGVTHELVRHRVASYSQESTRYANYAKDKFGKEITVVRPFFWDTDSAKYRVWQEAMRSAEAAYIKLIEEGARPQEARSVLPNSLKTEIVMTANLREWRHVFRLRCDKAAHPQMREIMLPCLEDFNTRLPILFNDLYQRFEPEMARLKETHLP